MNQEKENNKGSNFLKDLEKKLKNSKNKQNRENKPKNSKKNNHNNKFSLFLIISLLLAGFLLFANPNKNNNSKPISYSEFIQAVENNQVKECTIINKDRIVFQLNGVKRETTIPYIDQDLIPMLLENNVVILPKEEQRSVFFQILINIIPWIIFLFIFYFLFIRQFRGKNGGAFSFGRSKAKLVNQSDIKTTFKDVEGCQEAKEDLEEVVSFLKNPQKYIKIGAQIPKGILLIGPPGTGKTLLAKAVAGEAKVPFFSMSGSDFVEMFVGVGASRVRDLFDTGRKHSPCILFIDEIDAVGRSRGAGYGGGHDEREQTLNQMLVEMDGFDSNHTIIVMAATNRSDVLDKALLRPGRFDRQVVVDVPDVKGRKGILKLHSKKIKLNNDVRLDDIARGTAGFTGADLANLVNEGALLSARKNKDKVSHIDLENARDKVLMGAERKSMLISPEEKKMTAYHEAGHALVGILLKSSNPLHKVTIIPRGRALGLTWFLPEDGKHSHNKKKIEDEIMILFGGRIAEELILREVSTGASNDIERATKLARSMVTEFGMSKLGPISYGGDEKPLFIGGEVLKKDTYSEETAKKIDLEVTRILNTAYNNTVKLLNANLSKLKKFSEKLIEKEVMDVDEIYKLLKMKKPKMASL